MTSVRIYGKKGMIEAKPFKINSVDIDPEPIGEEKQIINSSASDTEQTDEIQGSAPDE